MSTITRSRASPSAPASAPLRDARFAVRDADWNLYDRLSDAIGEGKNVRLAFDGRDLEIMTTGPLHESLKDWLGVFAHGVAVGLKIGCQGVGQTTWKRRELNRGLESD
jgi:hypothetical protein